MLNQKIDLDLLKGNPGLLRWLLFHNFQHHPCAQLKTVLEYSHYELKPFDQKMTPYTVEGRRRYVNYLPSCPYASL